MSHSRVRKKIFPRLTRGGDDTLSQATSLQKPTMVIWAGQAQIHAGVFDGDDVHEVEVHDEEVCEEVEEVGE